MEGILKGRVDSRVWCQVLGVQTQMQSFNFVFGIQMRVLVLRHTDNSSSKLQYTHMYMSYYKAQQFKKYVFQRYKA